MALESLKPLASGLHPQLPKVLAEIQGLAVNVLAGAAANTKINLAALRQEDTLVSALMFAAGVPSDITGTATIEDLRASGTITVATPVAGATVTIAGRVYTFRATGTAKEGQSTVEVNLGANNNATAANLAAAINKAEGSGPVFATVSTNVVTIKARAEGTGGNSITLNSSDTVTTLQRSGATLAGGSATGGIRFSGNTTGNTIVLVWFNKR